MTIQEITEGWLRAEATPQAPAPLLGATLDRVAVTPQDRHLWRRDASRSRRRSSHRDLVAIAAAAMIALGTGALLFAAGQSPAPMPTWHPPTGLVTEQIGPGVVRVLGDDAGHEVRRPGAVEPTHDLAFTRDDGVWALGHSGLVRLGLEGTYPGPWRRPSGPTDLTGAPDGTLWALSDDTVASFRDGTWTVAPEFPGIARALEILPDGQVWASSSDTLARLDGDAWTAFGITDGDGHAIHGGSEPRDLAWTRDGSFWIRAASGDRLLRFDGSSWSSVFPPGGEGPEAIGLIAAGPNAEVWVYENVQPPPSCPGGRDHGRLARYHGRGWDIPTHAAPRIQFDMCYYGDMVVDADGRLWATARDRIAVYDGNPWVDVYPSPDVPSVEDYPGASIQSPLAVAPDGSIWQDPGGVGYLVLTR